MSRTRLPVRVAIRQEGKFVNAYMAPANTMENAKLLGSFQAEIAASNPDLFERWKTLMSDVMVRAVERAFGRTPAMTEETAPERERSGNA